MISYSEISFSPAEVACYCHARNLHMVRQGSQLRGKCPIHGGERLSFAMERQTGRWYCHSTCGRGGDLIALEIALTGSDFLEAKQAIFDLLGRPVDHRVDRVDKYQSAVRQAAPKPLAQPKPRLEPKPEVPQSKMAVIAIYDYQDESGALLYHSDPKIPSSDTAPMRTVSGARSKNSASAIPTAAAAGSGKSIRGKFCITCRKY